MMSRPFARITRAIVAIALLALPARMTAQSPRASTPDAHARLARAARELADHVIEGATIVELSPGERWAVGVGAVRASLAPDASEPRSANVVGAHRARREVVRLILGSRVTGRSQLGRSESDRGEVRERFDEQLVEEVAGTLVGVETITSGERANGVRWVAVACRVETCRGMP